MDMSDFYNEIWGILPEKLDGLTQYFHENQSFVHEHMSEFKAAIISKRKENAPNYTVLNGVAIIPITGTISKQESFWSYFFSGASVETLTRDFKAALSDQKVKAILFQIDSPGGTITGLDSLATLIFDSKQIKPSVAFTDGLMASAAYWIGSAAGSVIAEKTASIGSIGVMTVHYDYSKNDEQYGLKRTYLSAGKYKTVGNDSEPLSAFAKDYFQKRLDYFYSMFVDTVARNRGVPTKKALSMADGKLFIGQQALDAGLVDGIGELDDAIEVAADMGVAMTDKKKNQFSLTANTGANEMKFKTVDEMVEAHPEFCKEVFDKGAASIKADEIKTEAVTAEKDRIVGLAVIQLGEKKGKKFKAVIESGITAEQFKAVAPEVVADGDGSSEKDLKAELLAAIKGAGPQSPGLDTKPTTEAGKDFLSLVADHRAAFKSSVVDAMKAVMKADPEAHEKYQKSVN